MVFSDLSDRGCAGQSPTMSRVIAQTRGPIAGDEDTAIVMLVSLKRSQTDTENLERKSVQPDPPPRVFALLGADAATYLSVPRGTTATLGAGMKLLDDSA